MMLDQVLQSAIDGHRLTPTRVRPMRTAVKQFSTMFGVTPEHLGPEQYHLPKDALFRFIEQHSARDVGPSKLRNTKNNIRWLLDLAVQEHWIPQRSDGSRTWMTRHRIGRMAPSRTRLDKTHASATLYSLLQPLPESIETIPPLLRQWRLAQRQGRQLAPQAFRDEIQAYLDWCQHTYAPGRDAKIKKRAISAHDVQKSLLCVGGYAHHLAGIPLDELTLERLTQPAFVEAFVSWWVNDHRGRVTATIQQYIINLIVVARHWLKSDERAEAIKTILLSLPNDHGPVWDKEKALVPLRTIEDVGVKMYPFTAERMQRNWHLRTLYAHMLDPDHAPLTKAWIAERDASHIGSQVMLSLIIRLLVRLPMRQRCIREMRLGHNLKQLPDGNWEVHFRGTELKISSRKSTGINEYRHPVPTELNGLIHEWLTFWRPRRLPDEETSLVFLSRKGRPLLGELLNKRFINAVYRFTGVRTTIHMVRDSWASDYLDATGDVTGCADMLGDTVPVILKHYAHVLKRRAQGRTALWLQTQLGGLTNIDRPEGGTGTPR